MTQPRPRMPLRAVAARLASPIGRRLAPIGRQPAICTVVAAWLRLLEEACDLVAPIPARLVGELRLVAVPRPAGGFDFFLVRSGVATPLAEPLAVAKLRDRVELRLHPHQTLEQSLSLPAASRDYLDTIIDHRLERLAPWRREAILHGYEISADDGSGHLTVRVLLTSADIVTKLVSALRQQGLEPVRIGAEAESPAQPLRVVLGRGADLPRPSWQHTFGRVWLAGMAALGTLAVTASLMASMEKARLTEAERHLVKARRLIREAANPALSDALPLLAEKLPERATMVLIDKLAAALPNTSYLRELAVTPDDIRLVGTSADAPALIPLIEKAGFYNVRFTGPVSRDENKRDAFEITADRAAARSSQ